MFESIIKFFKKLVKTEEKQTSSKETAKERLHLVLMQDRANMSADFLELMKQEIIEVIKKYIDIEEDAIDVRLKNKVEEDGTNGAPFLYANIPVLNMKSDLKKEVEQTKPKGEDKKDEKKNIENDAIVVTDSKESTKNDETSSVKDKEEEAETHNDTNKKPISVDNKDKKEIEDNKEDVGNDALVVPEEKEESKRDKEKKLENNTPDKEDKQEKNDDKKEETEQKNTIKKTSNNKVTAQKKKKKV